MLKKSIGHDKNSEPMISSPWWTTEKMVQTQAVRHRKEAKPQKIGYFCNYIVLVYCLHSTK